MKKTTSHIIIRFRRWTRKGYAIFCSLGRSVTIGTLGREVADASLKKQKAGIFNIPASTDQHVFYDDEPEDDLPNGIPANLGLIGFFLPANETYCSDYNYYIKTNFNNISRKDILYLSGYFFIRYTIYD